jgi:hypothetical protein
VGHPMQLKKLPFAALFFLATPAFLHTNNLEIEKINSEKELTINSEEIKLFLPTFYRVIPLICVDQFCKKILKIQDKKNYKEASKSINTQSFLEELFKKIHELIKTYNTIAETLVQAINNPFLNISAIKQLINKNKETISISFMLHSFIKGSPTAGQKTTVDLSLFLKYMLIAWKTCLRKNLYEVAPHLQNILLQMKLSQKDLEEYNVESRCQEHQCVAIYKSH